MKISDWVVRMYKKGHSVDFIYHELYRKFRTSEPPITLYHAHYLVEKSITDYLLNRYL